MKKKASIVLILFMLTLLFLPGQTYAEDAANEDVIQVDDIPCPQMYRGSFEQGAVVCDSIRPFSLFTQVWYDGIDSLYFVTEGDTSALFCWNFREWTLDILAVEDGFGTFEKTLAIYQKSCAGESFILDTADKDTLRTFKEALTKNWVIFEEGLSEPRPLPEGLHPAFTSVQMGENTIRYDEEELYLETDEGARLIPTPRFSSIDCVIPLSPSLIACVSTTEGISIANITLQPQKLLSIDGAFGYEAERFAIANPDVRVNIVYGTDRFSNRASAPDFEIDVMIRNAAIVEEVYQNGLIADLSSSDILTQAIDLIHPAFQRYLSKDGKPFAFPDLFLIDLIAYKKPFFEKHGYPEIPATMEELLSNLESTLSQTELEGEEPEEDVLELMAQSLNYDLLSLYVYQEPDTDEPMRFDTDVFRAFLTRIKAFSDQVKSFVETHDLRPMRFSYTEPSSSGDYYYYADFPMDSDDIRYCIPFSIKLYWGLTWTLAMGYMPIAPPTARPDADLYTGFDMKVATIDAQSPRYEEAVRFLEFYSRIMDPDAWAFLSAGKVNIPYLTDNWRFAYLHVMEEQLEQYIGAGANASNREAARRKLQEAQEALEPYREDSWPRNAEYFSYYQKDIIPTLRLESDSKLLDNVRRIMSCPPFSYWGNTTIRIITVEQDDTTPVKEAIINQYAFGEASMEEIIDYLNEAAYEDYQWRIRWK